MLQRGVVPLGVCVLIVACNPGRGGSLVRLRTPTVFPTACHNLAVTLQGQGDWVRVRELLDQACRGGVGAACHNLAVYLQDGVGGAPDPAGAAQAYAKAWRSPTDQAVPRERHPRWAQRDFDLRFL